MKRKALIVICLLLTLLVGAAYAQRIKKHGALVDVSSAGAITITPAALRTHGSGRVRPLLNQDGADIKRQHHY